MSKTISNPSPNHPTRQPIEKPARFQSVALLVAWALLLTRLTSLRANVVDFASLYQTDSFAADLLVADNAVQPQTDNTFFHPFGAPFGYPPVAPSANFDITTPVLSDVTTVHASSPAALVITTTPLNSFTAPPEAAFAFVNAPVDLGAGALSSNTGDTGITAVHVDPERLPTCLATPDSATNPVLDSQPPSSPAAPGSIPLPTSATSFIFLSGALLTLSLFRRRDHFA
jgi:hypothetical protein